MANSKHILYLYHNRHKYVDLLINGYFDFCLVYFQALQLHVNPLYIMFPTAIATSFAFMLPVATPPNAVVFSYGHLKVIDMVSCLFITI